MAIKIFNNKKKIFLILAVLILSVFIISPVLAAAGDYTPLVKIPRIDPNAGLLVYLNGVYKFVISVVGILAMAVLIYGGMLYITSAGNTARVGEAKESINAALAGLLLALISWVIFATINKDILVLKNVGVGLPEGKYMGAGDDFICAYPGGDPKTGCKCLDYDDKKKNLVYANPVGATATKITLTANPASPINAAVFDVNIILTKNDGTPISGMILKWKEYKSDYSSSSANYLDIPNPTNSAGKTSFSQYYSNCYRDSIFEVVFPGDTTTYAPSSAIIHIIVTSPMSACSALPVSGGTLWKSGNTCQEVCSNKLLALDSAYHCMKADLRIGRGEYKTCGHVFGKEAIIKVCEALSWDPTHSVSKNPITKYEVIVNNNPLLCSFSSSVCDGFRLSNNFKIFGCIFLPGENTLKLKITDSASNSTEDNSAIFTIEGVSSISNCL